MTRNHTYCTCTSSTYHAGGCGKNADSWKCHVFDRKAGCRVKKSCDAQSFLMINCFCEEQIRRTSEVAEMSTFYMTIDAEHCSARLIEFANCSSTLLLSVFVSRFNRLNWNRNFGHKRDRNLGEQDRTSGPNSTEISVRYVPNFGRVRSRSSVESHNGRL